jgi:hypothetical protein
MLTANELTPSAVSILDQADEPAIPISLEIDSVL